MPTQYLGRIQFITRNTLITQVYNYEYIFTINNIYLFTDIKILKKHTLINFQQTFK